MFMKYHWYAKFPIKKQQTVDIHLIKDETVIFNGINFKIHQIIWICRSDYIGKWEAISISGVKFGFALQLYFMNLQCSARVG